MIAIIDYDMGNIHSVQKALGALGGRTIVTNNPKDIASSAKVVLPGVGAFDDAMQSLSKRNLVTAIKKHIRSGKIFLGICLGMQLLFEESEEAKITKGLSILKGKVKRFKYSDTLKVPHMGWNQLSVTADRCPLLKGLGDSSYVYFCHSYYPKPQDKDVTAATTDYGINFTSIVWQDNVYGVQFHPEKSQKTGLTILKNFLAIPSVE